MYSIGLLNCWSWKFISHILLSQSHLSLPEDFFRSSRLPERIKFSIRVINFTLKSVVFYFYEFCLLLVSLNVFLQSFDLFTLGLKQIFLSLYQDKQCLRIDFPPIWIILLIS